MKNINIKIKTILWMLATAACIFIFIPQSANAYTSKTLCGDTCELNRNSNLYMVANASLISPIIKGTYSFREGYGKNIYFNDPLLYGIFIGGKIADGIGFELGYETQRAKKRITRILPGEPLPGNVYVDDCTIFLDSVARTEHWQALLHVNLNELDSKSKFNLWGQVGLSYSQIRASHDILLVIEQAGPYEFKVRRTFKSKKIIPVVKFGGDYNITENLGIRTSIGWSNLRLLTAKSKEAPSSHSEIRLGDECNIALGIVYKF